MELKLQRALCPEQISEEIPCLFCDVRFRPGSVVVVASQEHTYELVCPECLAYVGRRNPERFPTWEQYEEALRRFPKPIWASQEEVNRAEREGTYWPEWDRSFVN
jgi:hypothetical protein